MDELEKKALELALSMGDGVELAVNRLFEEAPLYVQELLMYYFYRGMLVGLVCIIVSVCVVVFFHKVVKKLESDDPGYFIGSMFCILLFGIFTVGALVNLEHSLKIGLAPRVYIVDYIKDGLSSNK